jgi:hypothetical protein
MKEMILEMISLKGSNVQYLYDEIKKLQFPSNKYKTTNNQTTTNDTQKNKPLVPGGSPAADEQQKPKETIVKDFDRAWDYKKIGDDVYVKRKNTEKWTKVGGETKSSILSQVFKDTKACVYPAGELCPNYIGFTDVEKEGTSNTKIGFCSKKYCTVKYIQSLLDTLIAIEVEPLKGFSEIKIDGKFGKNTKNLVFALTGNVTATPNEIKKKYDELTE